MLIYLKCLWLNLKNINTNKVFFVSNFILHLRTIIKEENQESKTKIIQYFVDGKLHRENDKPAYVKITKTAITSPSWDKGKFNISNISIWYKNGEPHRENDKPAYIENENIKKWYIKGLLNRENDKPAIIYFDSLYWYKDGQLHRDNDEPAYQESKFSNTIFIYKWYQHGKLHRINKPAIQYPFSYGEEYYLDNKLHSFNSIPSSNLVDSEFSSYFKKVCLINRVKRRGKTTYIKHKRNITWHIKGKEITESQAKLNANITNF